MLCLEPLLYQKQGRRKDLGWGDVCKMREFYIHDRWLVYGRKKIVITRYYVELTRLLSRNYDHNLVIMR